MATCKDDCIHYNVCNYHIDEETPFEVTECNNFKNKADFVEVVRCKDCKWATKRIKENGFFTHQCCNTIAFGMSPRRATDFCSYGERKLKNDFKE